MQAVFHGCFAANMQWKRMLVVFGGLVHLFSRPSMASPDFLWLEGRKEKRGSHEKAVVCSSSAKALWTLTDTIL